MGEEATTSIPNSLDDNVSLSENGTSAMTFTVEERITAYCVLYLMTLFCITLGSFRSLRFVIKRIRNKQLIESSITVAEAKMFPITASLILFGLYIIFKSDADSKERLLGYLKEYVPAKVVSDLERLLSYANLTAVVPEVSDEKSSTFNIRKVLSFMPAVNKANAMYLLLIILCFEGSAALSILLKSFFSYILRRLPIGDIQPKINLPYFCCVKVGKHEMKEGDIENADKKDFNSLWKVEFDTHDCVSLLLCLGVGLSHLLRRHWITNNILGVAFSIYGIENLHLASFKAGTALLAGLFVYDIFWVFATDVMTTVARGIDAPILLQFPQDIFRTGWKADKYAMLGLGDIVIPGTFIALLLRFDNRIMEFRGSKTGKRYYFKATTFAYAFGLLLTMLMMHLFKAAQPALLYLVPVCLLVPLSLAAIRGEAGTLWNYCEEGIVQTDPKDADDDSPKHNLLKEASAKLSAKKNKKD